MSSFLDSLEQRRLFAAGAPDTTFGGGDGSVDVRTSTHSRAISLSDAAVDSQGRTILGSFYRSAQQITLTRVNADGTVDTTFGSNGIVTMASGFNAKAKGEFQITTDHADRVLVLLKNRLTRVKSSGGVDTKFGTGGSATIPVMSAVTDVTVDSRDRPVIVGTSQGKTGTRGTVIRLGPKGVVDTSFGGGGAYKTPVPQYQGTGHAGDATGAAIKVLDDGRIVGVTSFTTTRSADETYQGENGTSSFRLDAVGTVDTSYGKSGFTRTAGYFAEYSHVGAQFEAFYPDGGMIIGKPTSDIGTDTNYQDKTWTRISKDGSSADAVFEGLQQEINGQEQTPIAPPYRVRVAAIGPDNKPLLATETGDILRYTTAFKLDSSFNYTPTTSYYRTFLAVRGRVITVGDVVTDGEAVPSSRRVSAIQL